MSFTKPAITRSAALVVAALLLISAPSFAEAKNLRPFKGRVVATWDNVFAALPPPAGISLAKFIGTSQMTHMGNAAQSGTLTLTPNGHPFLIPGNGSVTITAANGDTVKFDYTGILNAANGEGTGTFNITGGTGRFAGATGGGTFFAAINFSSGPVNAPMTVVLDGQIDY